MLVLTRKLNEQIVVANTIRITVLSIRGQQVRLGIEAPADVPIFREEIARPRAQAASVVESGAGGNGASSRRV